MATPKSKIKLTLRPASQLRPRTSPPNHHVLLQQEPIFTFFPKLSLELQLLIWNEVVQFFRIIRIESSHIVLVYPDGRIDSKNDIVAKHPIPSILHACHQSRQLGLKYYQLISGRYCDDPFYINLKVDALLVRGATEILTLWRHHDYWFPERREQPILGKELPMLILDPSHGSQSRSSPTDPDEEFDSEDVRLLRNHKYERFFKNFLFCFEKVVLLEPRHDHTVDEKTAYEIFKSNFWKDMFVFSFWGRHNLFPVEELPVWFKEGVQLWSQDRFQRYEIDGKLDGSDDTASRMTWRQVISK